MIVNMLTIFLLYDTERTEIPFARLVLFVVKYRKLLLIIASILLIPSLLGYLQAEINYDVTSYLPQQLASKQGQDILERDFRIAANSYVMVENWETYQIVQLKEQIEKVPGVEKASWLNDLYHPSVPAFLYQKR